MKKSNIITLIVFFVLILGDVVYSHNYMTNMKNNTSTDENNTLGVIISPSQTPEDGALASDLVEDDNDTTEDPADLSDALFIGDSRTMGIMEYAGITEADFFCNTGMSVFNVKKEQIAVSDLGKVTLDELLEKKVYGKIYIMLGMNELGYSFQQIVDEYGRLYDFIREQQPDAILFIQANLHVTAKRSEQDEVFNNAAINRLNTELAKLADDTNSFYLDVNPLFDDAGGNLTAEKSSDDAHLYAKYYLEWGEWIRMQTAKKV